MLLHTGEGINALVDMINVALAMMMMASGMVWRVLGPLSGGLGLDGRGLGPDIHCLCTVPWSALSAFKGQGVMGIKEPTIFESARSNQFQYARPTHHCLWMTSWD